MTNSELVALVDQLRSLPAETEWLEFKRNRHEPQAIGEYLSALANAACLASQPRGCLEFGVDNGTHAVVGTPFDPYATKAKGNQDLLPWLAAGLRPNTGVEVHVLEHPEGRVVLFEAGPARGEPVAFYGTPYIRVGTSKTELRHHPEKARELWTRVATGRRRCACRPRSTTSTLRPWPRPGSSSASNTPARPQRSQVGASPPY